jgi:hypothetical protein
LRALRTARARLDAIAIASLKKAYLIGYRNALKQIQHKA